MTVIVSIILVGVGVVSGIVVGYTIGHFRGAAVNGYEKKLTELLEKNEAYLKDTRSYVAEVCKALQSFQ